MRVTTYRAISITPFADRTDGREITDADKGLALLHALRSCSQQPFSLSQLRLTAADIQHGETAELLHVEINGEVICSIPLTP